MGLAHAMDERPTGSAGAAAAFIALITLLTLAALFAPPFSHPTVELLAAPTAQPVGPAVEFGEGEGTNLTWLTFP